MAEYRTRSPTLLDSLVGFHLCLEVLLSLAGAEEGLLISLAFNEMQLTDCLSLLLQSLVVLIVRLL